MSAPDPAVTARWAASPDLAEAEPTDPATTDWALVHDQAVATGLGPALWWAIHDHPWLELVDPARLADLETEWKRARTRNEIVRDDLVPVLDSLAAADIEVVAFGGTHMLVDQIWPDLGCRPTTLARLLVHDGSMAGAAAAARDAGFVASPGHGPDRIRLGRLADDPTLELRCSAVTTGWGDLLRPEEIWARAEARTWRGRSLLVPSGDDAITIALVQGWLADDHWFRGTAPLRATIETARLARTTTDWQLVATRLGRARRKGVVARHRVLAAAWFGAVGPERDLDVDIAHRWLVRLPQRMADPDSLLHRVRRAPYAFDSRRLRRRYGDGSALSVQLRRAAGVLRRSD